MCPYKGLAAHTPDAAAPDFAPDGCVRRDAATGAPVFVAGAAAVAHLPPRFNADGTVARDEATGAPLFEHAEGGRVVRVLVVLP